MVKRIVVAGCRDYDNYDEASAFIEQCIQEIGATHTLILLSGGCKGADLLGERFAREHGFAIEHYPADWKKYGKSAGPKRNREMAKACDYVICFWNGKSRGTASMIAYAEKLEKQIWVKYI